MFADLPGTIVTATIPVNIMQHHHQIKKNHLNPIISNLIATDLEETFSLPKKEAKQNY